MTRRPGNAFVGFVLTGGFAAGVNVAARWVFSVAMIYELAVTLAYLLGMTVAFVLARLYVFDAGKRSWTSAYVRFAIVNAASFVIVLAVSVGLARGLFPIVGFRWHAEDVAHVIGVASPVLFSFYAHKHFSFGEAGRA